ncbi:MAG: O-antigen ligase family protein [Bacteroidales bacterium]|nr:O-antigen ligase family protein [Bacteroidales bacterium]
MTFANFIYQSQYFFWGFVIDVVMIFSKELHRYIYILGVVLFAIALPLSVFLMSVSQFIIYINWLIEGNFKNKWLRFKTNRCLWLFISMYLIHILWTFFPQPQNIDYALNDLRIKLPLMLLPIFMATSQPFSSKEIKWILLSFTSAVTFVGFIGIVRYIFKDHLGIIDYRNFIPFISHVRYSLMIVFSVVILFYYLKINDSNQKQKLILLINLIFLVAIIFILRVNTAVFLFIALILFLLIIHIFRNFDLKKFVISMAILVSILCYVSYTLYHIYKDFLNAYHSKIPNKVIYNINNKPFVFLEESKEVENGKRVYFYFVEEELKREWNKKSDYKYDGYDLKGNKIKYTLIRYLTSKGLTKDSIGINQLSDQDIKAIEKGIPNVIYLKRFSLYSYLYSFVWEFYNYFYLDKVAGSSLFQRIEYQKTAIKIIQNNFWIGVGTGNVQEAFNEAYFKYETKLNENIRHRAHNQYLTFFISFGLFGFLAVFIAFILPFLKEISKNYRVIKITFFIICLLSFLTEDTLETQAGVSFVVLFYTLFTFALAEQETKKIH